MKSEIKEEIQNYIRYINGHDLEDQCEEYIQMLFFLSQMMLEKDLELDERVIQSMAQKLVEQIGQTLNTHFGSYDKGMCSELGMLTFSIHEIMGRTGELKETSELLNRFLLDQACQKAELFQQRKLSFDSYDMLGGIAGVVYYLLDCEEIVNKPEGKLKLRELIRFLIYLSGDYSYWGKHILRYHIRRRQQFLAIEQKTMKQGHINFGTAHGVAGQLVALAKAKRKGIQEMYLEEAIWKLFGLYEELCVEENGIVRYPRRLPVDCYVSKTSADLTENAGWCYGNLGIVRSLMKTAKCLRKPMKYAYYLDKLVDILAQPAKEYNLSSPIVCHGYGSVITIQTYAFLESQDERCLVNLKRNMEITLREHRKKMQEEGYREDFSLLNGSAGTILALCNSMTSNLTYGKLLFMD